MLFNNDAVKGLSLVPLRWLILILGDSRLMHFKKSQPEVLLGPPSSGPHTAHPGCTRDPTTGHRQAENHFASTLEGQLNNLTDARKLQPKKILLLLAGQRKGSLDKLIPVAWVKLGVFLMMKVPVTTSSAVWPEGSGW